MTMETDVFHLEGAHIDRLAVRIVEALDARPVQVIPVADVPAGSGLSYSGPCLLLGFALASAAPSSGALWDGPVNSGTLLAGIGSTTGLGQAYTFPGGGVPVSNSLILSVLAGDLFGALYIRPYAR